MSLSNRGLNLDIRSLEIVLYTVLHKLIGLKWFTEEGLWTLGINTTSRKPVRCTENLLNISSKEILCYFYFCLEYFYFLVLEIALIISLLSITQEK